MRGHPRSKRVALPPDLFLTDEVRLHCGDCHGGPLQSRRSGLFLTDEVRLHCGDVDLVDGEAVVELFLTDEVRLHCGGIPRAITEPGFSFS